MKRKTRIAIIEGIKQVIRVALIGIVPVMIAQLQTETWDWKVIGVAGEIAVLMGFDKWLHKSDIETPLDMKRWNP